MTPKPCIDSTLTSVDALMPEYGVRRLTDMLDEAPAFASGLDDVAMMSEHDTPTI